MAVREILIYPDPRLLQVSSPVSFPLSDDVKQLIVDMADTMYDAPGVGLAAPQVGVPLRLAITDTVWRDEEVRHDDSNKVGGRRELKVWINPEFVWKSEEMATWEEGCLSVPQTYGDVSRPAAVRLRWFDENGVEHEQDFEGFQAVALQHEFDHLDGKLFVDYLSPLKRKMITKKMKKFYKGS
ncbi:peptide deformylase [Mariprofundus erugo]|uniref:Peptide deformylase n=1 Tax=Mariprofundus erugo TaxID=2528639 RepID=A0A5R9GZL9_9PROT|nr:peptide deformylase [Mariprofundus erugo]TLS69132.1 peptide deformylase [Mariprofundus erugo]TLS73993.1 peptide deformylase [Mariprofundus erugo]